MKKKLFNDVIDDAISDLVTQENLWGVCNALYSNYTAKKHRHEFDRGKLSDKFEDIMKPLSKEPHEMYWLGVPIHYSFTEGEKNLTYRVYMLEWFRCMANEHKWYRDF